MKYLFYFFINKIMTIKGWEWCMKLNIFFIIRLIKLYFGYSSIYLTQKGTIFLLYFSQKKRQIASFLWFYPFSYSLSNILIRNNTFTNQNIVNLPPISLLHHLHTSLIASYKASISLGVKTNIPLFFQRLNE